MSVNRNRVVFTPQEIVMGEMSHKLTVYHNMDFGKKMVVDGNISSYSFLHPGFVQSCLNTH